MAEAPAASPLTFPRYGFSATEPGAPVTDSATGAHRVQLAPVYEPGGTRRRGWRGRVESHARRGGPGRSATGQGHRNAARHRRRRAETPARRSHR